MVLSDNDIRQLAQSSNMISPFVDVCPDGVLSYGLSSAGYDVRLAPELLIDTGSLIDPKADNSHAFRQFHADENRFLIPAHGFALGRSVEYLRIPDNVMVLCYGKSTYARCGIILNVTPLEPGWEGHITLELSNTTNSPVAVYAGEGIVQLVFHPMSSTPLRTYAGKGGIYHKQRGITLPRVRGAAQ